MSSYPYIVLLIKYKTTQNRTTIISYVRRGDQTKPNQTTADDWCGNHCRIVSFVVGILCAEHMQVYIIGIIVHNCVAAQISQIKANIYMGDSRILHF